MYTGAKAKVDVACGFCGRALGKEYHFTCHVCGASFCYSHRPQRCEHKKLPTVPPVGT